ncbi:hypothetical protein PPERSA_06438 [Pseudocohnilembus persalinus]|uniref:EF-hand domain-containing protein n=1 Tax=Pseudocohnilembus persalinus TaxID=266149 RepID=A0A0V0QRA5_PSEPJ|nr:hypothetical protein PPERSA_06438 [Pseudocohnilembus persalinus]|eukprot:KRX04804.1 hypothetical protein PPERSA_06438 [Pseudocohnilembus persalinus]
MGNQQLKQQHQKPNNLSPKKQKKQNTQQQYLQFQQQHSQQLQQQQQKQQQTESNSVIQLQKDEQTKFEVFHESQLNQQFLKEQLLQMDYQEQSVHQIQFKFCALTFLRICNQNLDPPINIDLDINNDIPITIQKKGIMTFKQFKEVLDTFSDDLDQNRCSQEQAYTLFQQLDNDKDNKLSLQEFYIYFQETVKLYEY